MKKYSIKELINLTPREKHDFNHRYIWWRISMKYPGLIMTMICLRFNIKANTVTFFSIFLGILGCFLIANEQKSMSLLGVLCVHVWQFLDDVDGNIARLTSSNSKYGAFIDDLGGLMIYAFLYFCLGIHVLSRPEVYFNNIFFDHTIFKYNIFILIIGASCSLFYLLRLLQNHVFTNIYNHKTLPNTSENNKNNKKFSLRNIYHIFHLNFLELPGFLLLIIALSIMSSQVDIFLIIYFMMLFFDLQISIFRHASRLHN